MKKFFFSIVALAAVVAGCSKSEVINAPGADTPISFDTYFGKAATKAAVYEVNNLHTDGFQVVAFDHAAGVTPDYTSTPWHTFDLKYTTGWDYEGARQYWPSNGNQVDFLTYPEVNGVALNAEKKGFTFIVADDPADQVDLVAAPAALNKKAEVVNFTFKHLLSRVAFYLDNTGTGSVTIKSVKLHGDFYSEGTVDLTAESLAVTPTTAKSTADVTFDGETTPTTVASYELLSAAATLSGDDYISKEYMMLIPATAEGISVTYTIGDETTEYKVVKRFASEVNLAAASAYKFTFVVSSDAISFTVTETDLTWGTESEAGSITL